MAIIEENKIATENYNRWKNAQSYLGAKGFTSLVPECIDFYEGRQWPQVTPKTRFIPRPVINFVKKIIDNKQSNILGTPVHLNFRADNDEASTERFTKFANYQMKEMQMDRIDAECCHNGLVNLGYVYYFYWDADAIGQKSNVEGALRAESVDPLELAVENPVEKDIQKQKWVMVRTREDVEAVRKLCENEEKAKRIESDSYDGRYEDDIEQQNNDRVYVYTRFYRIDNEVYYEKSTQTVDIHGPIPMNPYLVAKLMKNKEEKDKNNENSEQYKIDPAVSTNMDENNELDSISDSELNAHQMKFSLYPFEMGALNPRNKCIYGIPEVEGIINTQKAVNFEMSMILLQSQQIGWGKYIVKPGALRGQKITNEPGQILTDFTPVGQVGIKQLEGQQIPNGAFNLINQLIELSRAVTNSSDVVTGEMMSRDLSGTAIAQIQAQAQKPIEQMQKLFWRSKERIGKILEQYYKLFYENTDYSYEISEEEYSIREEQMRKLARQKGYEGRLPKISKSAMGTFNGKDYEKTPFNIVVEAGKGTQYSEIMKMDFANNLIMNGNIDKISPENLELLIEMYPDSAIPNKADLKRYIRHKEESTINQLKEQLQQAAQLLQQAQVQMQQKDAQISGLTKYNEGLKKEFTDKINVANKQIGDMENFMKSQRALADNQNSNNSKN